MMTLIEPNLHPILVHFTVGLLVTAALLLAVSAFASTQKSWHASMQSAGDWMLMLGLAAAMATLIAGFVAYYTVAHDTPSHAAMTVHRNWAIATLILFLGVGYWRSKRRKAVPSPLFALVLLSATCLLATTAWWGGSLVYEYGIGVQSLPAASGEGHDHEHGSASQDHSAGMDTEDHVEAGSMNHEAQPALPAPEIEHEPTNQDQEHSDGPDPDPDPNHDHDHDH